MEPFPRVLEHYDLLWRQAECFVRAYFARHGCPPDRAPEPGELDAEGIEARELNTYITILKRIQDARRAIQLDAIKLKATENHAPDTPAENDDPEISRILALLGENGAEPDADRDDEEAV